MALFQCYLFLKDIVLPFSQLFTTIILGGFLVYYLNRRGNADKIKSLLIDHYLDYLKCFQNFHAYEYGHALAQFYSKIQEDDSINLNQSNMKEIQQTIEKVREKYTIDWFNQYANFTPFTYRFAFLLSKKVYDRKLQKLESEWVAQMMKGKDNMLDIAFLKLTKYWNDPVNTISKQNEFTEKCHAILSHEFNIHYTISFENYNTALANQIDKY